MVARFCVLATYYSVRMGFFFLLKSFRMFRTVEHFCVGSHLYIRTHPSTYTYCVPHACNLKFGGILLNVYVNMGSHSNCCRPRKHLNFRFISSTSIIIIRREWERERGLWGGEAREKCLNISYADITQSHTWCRLSQQFDGETQRCAENFNGLYLIRNLDEMYTYLHLYVVL